MKRVLATILIIIICLGALVGCTKQKKRRNTQNIRLLEACNIVSYI